MSKIGACVNRGRENIPLLSGGLCRQALHYRLQVSRRHSTPSHGKQPSPLAKSWIAGFSIVDLAIWIGLFLSVLLLYGQVEHFEFSFYDDPEYVTDNVHVRAGLTPETVRWAATAVVAGNWAPVTVLSHAAAVQLFGLESGEHHMINVLLHALAALVLFAALQRATKARWPSAFVAALFALHPVHVESVAWLAERKDVLYAFFGFLALYAYVRYAERPSIHRYIVVAALFALGLMSKPMLVTFPFLLLLLDYWPLRRARFPRVIWEKLPLLALSAADSVVTFLVQGSSGAVQVIPLAFRLRSALVASVVYIGQMFVPVHLAVFYPYRAVPMWQAALAAVVLLAISTVATLRWRAQPYLATGWFWFLGTLVPVIGIVQVGSQAHADRYTYIPLIGLSIMLAWGAADALRKWPQTRTPIATIAALSCVAWMILTARQAATWQNSGRLFQHAVDVTKDNYVAENGLAMYLAQTGRGAEAIPHFEAVLRSIPDDAKVHNALGILYAATPDHKQQAIAHFQAAIRNHPDYMEAQYNLGLALSQEPGRAAEALAHLEAAYRLQPSSTIAQAIENLRSAQR